ncbi:hypothetical protein CFK35_18230, partial [Clostridium sp. cpc1]
DNKGCIYFTCSSKGVVKLDSNGKEIWTYEGYNPGAIVVDKNYVYLTGGSNTISKITKELYIKK